MLPGRAGAQSGTVTDDAFLSSNPATQVLNFNGQGISLVVAGGGSQRGGAPVGTSTTYIKFQLQSSLPPNSGGANVAKATLKLYLSPGTNPTGEITSFPSTSAWSEGTRHAGSAPNVAATPFASDVVLGKGNS